MGNKGLWERFKAHVQNEGVTKKRIAKLLTVFNQVKRGMGNNWDKLTRKDFEKFLTALHNDKFTKLDGQPLSGSSKSDIKKFIRQFWKWYKGNNETYPPEVSWIKTKISKDEKPEDKPTLSIKQIEQLANSFRKPELKLITLLLFDSGFRISEMLSVRKKDITYEDFNEGEKCFFIKCNESKTIIRKVDIPLFTEEIKDFLNTSYVRNLNDNEILFNISYEWYLKQLKQLGKKMLGSKEKRALTPHALRHSSATYYAGLYEGNMLLLGNRYGWAYGSKELQTYIRRSGAYQKQGAKKVYENEILKLKKQYAKLESDLEALKKLVIKQAKEEIARNRGN